LKWEWENKLFAGGPVLSKLLLLLVLTIPVAVPVYAEAPVLPRGKGEQCVEPTDVMRKDHMDFLVHHRDDTVYQGIRTRKHSLKNCVDCHVQEDDAGQFIPINAPDQFCSSCHEFASVKLDCFECHATVPDDKPVVLNLDQSDASMLSARSFPIEPSSK
jgi:hypothetical protein